MKIFISLAGDVVNIRARTLKKQIAEIEAFLNNLTHSLDTALAKAHPEHGKFTMSCEEVMHWERETLADLKEQLKQLENP